jgi:hypothetical protein
MAQEAEVAEEKKAHEIYLYGSLKELSLNGIAFKMETKKGRFLRIGATNLNYLAVSYEPDDPQRTKSHYLTGGIQVGLENRNSLTEKLTAFYGVDLTASIISMNDESTHPDYIDSSKGVSFAPGLSFGSGLILNVIKNLSVSLEVDPSFTLIFASSKNTDETSTDEFKAKGCLINFDIDDVKLALIYRW